MNILRKLLGNDAVISEPAPPAVAPPAAAPSPAAKAELLRAELAGADLARLTGLALTDKRAAMRILAAEALGALPTPRETWETIAHIWVDKDRRLSRMAREHVAAFARQADLEARAAALTGDFAALLDKPSIELTRLIELDSAYDQLKADAAKDAPARSVSSKGASATLVSAPVDAPTMSPTKGFEALTALRQQIGTRLEAGQDAQRQLIAIAREADAARLALVAQRTVADPLVHAELAERFAALDASAVPPVIVARTHKALVSLEQLVQSALARGAAELACRDLLVRIDLLDPADGDARRAMEDGILAAGLPQDLLVRAKDAYDLRVGGADAERLRLERETQSAARNAQKESRHAESKAANEALVTLITETEAHLAAGEAKAALKAVGAIKRHRADAERLAPALRARFHAIETEVLKLDGFAHDVARTRRAALMERVRKLPELKLNIDMLRSEIQTLQNDWKALDAEAGGAPRKLWDEFHAATNKAYETVTLYRAVKAAERDESVKAKEAVLVELEALVASVTTGVASGVTSGVTSGVASGVASDIASAVTEGVAAQVNPEATPTANALAAPQIGDAAGHAADADGAVDSAVEPAADTGAGRAATVVATRAQKPAAPEWNKLAARRGELVRRWYDLGGVGRKELKALQGRMDRAVKQLDAALDAERGRERGRRHALIAQVEAARVRAESERPADAGVNDRPWPALANAMQVAQDCQKQWNQRLSPLMLPRKEEQALWEKFRTLGNSVFEMRAQAREAVKAKHGAERELQTAHIAALRALLQETDRGTIQTRLTELQSAWRQLAVRPERGAERQYDDAITAVKTHLGALKRRDERSVWDALLDLDAAMAQAEQQPGAPEWAEKLAAIVPRLDPKHAAHPGIATRRAAVLDGKAVAAKTQRSDLLLDLELALGIPVQPGEEAARRARQMVLLSTTLKDRGVRREPREMLFNLIAHPGSTERRRLEAVIAKL